MAKFEHTIFLGLGTNLGDRLTNLETALAVLPPQVTIVERSPVYRTPPWGYEDQSEFLNMVVKGKTSLSPDRLLKYLKRIEKKVGRTASFRWGPREIDIDILFYDDLKFQDKHLTIPHPRLQDRAFMLVPLADLAPDLRHPVTGLTIHQHLESVVRDDIHELLPAKEI